MKLRLVQIAAVVLLAPSLCCAGDKGAEATAAASAPAAQSRVVFTATLRNGFAIRFDHREQRQQTSRLFLDAAGSSYVDVPTAEIDALTEEKMAVPPPAAPAQPEASPDDISAAVSAASDKHGIDEDLLYSVIRAESDFNPRAVSPKGARGLMQLMPETAGKLGVADAFDPAKNVEGGTRYLRELLDRYHYDLVLALAAYNAGPARVDQYHGVPPYYETRAYVARIVREYNKALARRRASAARQKRQSTVAAKKGLTASR